jgi:hypothetical protein
VGFPLILLGSFFATARNRRPAVAAGEDVCVRDTPQVAEP